MPKKGENLIHPLSAMKALDGFYRDVTALVMVAHNAADMLASDTLSKSAVAKTVAPQLAKAVADVRTWMEEP